MAEQKGQCQCGAVKFTATPKSQEVGVCHCGMCRRLGAGPYFAVDCGESFEIEDEDNLGVYNSSEWAERGFCKTCGAQIVWRTKDRKTNIVSINAFVDPGELVFDHEIFIDDKPDYYGFAQKTKQLTGQQVFEMFAGGQDNG